MCFDEDLNLLHKLTWLADYLAKDIMKLSWNSRLRALLNAPEPYVFFSMGAYILQNNPSAVFFGPPGWIRA
jgi:hypothetical protein